MEIDVLVRDNRDTKLLTLFAKNGNIYYHDEEEVNTHISCVGDFSHSKYKEVFKDSRYKFIKIFGSQV